MTSALPYLLLAACLVALVLARRGAPDTLTYEFLVFPEGCLNKLLGFDLDPFCIKKTISKCLGYGIIAGACIVKLPQIVAFVRAGSVAGMSREATYLELVGYLLASIYHLVNGSPWSAYGETVIVTFQTAAIVLMLWAYDPPSLAHMFGVTTVLAVAAQQAWTAPPAMQALVINSTIVLFIASRGWQLLANWQQGSTGQLAFLTLFMNFAGAAARIFTSLQEVKQVEVLVSFIVSTALNGALLWQYVYYNLLAPKPAAVAAPAAKKAAATPAAAAAAEDEAEGPASASGGARRRRRAA